MKEITDNVFSPLFFCTISKHVLYVKGDIHSLLVVHLLIKGREVECVDTPNMCP